MTEVVSIIEDFNVNRHLDTAKSANPHLHCLRQSHLIPAFNAMQLETTLTNQNEHRKVVVVAALTNIDHVHCLPWRRPAHPGCQDLFPAGHFLDSARQVLWWRHQSHCPDPASTVQNAATLVSSVLHLCSGVFWRGVQSSRTPNLDFTVVSRPRVRGGWLTLYLYIRASLCSALG